MSDKAEWEATDEVRGIRGWLLLPLFHLVFNPLYLAWLAVRQLPAVAAQAPANPVAAEIGFVVVLLPVFAFLVFCLVRFLQERREVPWLMTVFYGLSIAVVLVILVGRAEGYGFAGKIADTSLVARHDWSLLLQAAFAAAMIAYFHTSVRVRNTFFRASPPRTRAAPAGIGGWLVPVLVYVALWTALLISVIHAPMTLPARIAWSIGHGTIYVYRLIVSEALAAYAIYCLVRLFQRRRSVRRLMTILAALGVAYAVVFTLLPQPNAIWAGAIFAAAWLAIGAYFRLSQRVRNTFPR